MSELTDEELAKRLAEAGKGDKKNDKTARGVRDNLTLDPKIYELYDYWKKELGYDGDFSQFIVDMTIGNAKKNGVDIQIVKSAEKGRFIKGEVEDDEDGDEYEKAMALLGVNTGNPKQMAFQQLLEERRLQLEERRLKMEDMRLSMEAKHLDLERKKIENEKLRKEIGTTVQSPVDSNGNPIAISSMQQSQKDREFELYKMMNDNNMKFMEMLAKSNIDSGSSDSFMQYLMKKNEETNNTILALMNNYNEKKFQELENAIYSQSPDQQLARMKAQFDMFKEIGGTIGGQKTPEQLKIEAEIEMKKLELEREKAKEERDEARAAHLTEAIRDTIGNFTKSIGEPMGAVLAEQAKQKIKEAMNNKQNPPQAQEQQPAYTPPTQQQQDEPENVNQELDIQDSKDNNSAENGT